jgi:hypothetical protein
MMIKKGTHIERLQGPDFPLGRRGGGPLRLAWPGGVHRRRCVRLPHMPVLLQVQHRAGVRPHGPRHAFQGEVHLLRRNTDMLCVIYTEVAARVSGNASPRPKRNPYDPHQRNQQLEEKSKKGSAPYFTLHDPHALAVCLP